MRLLINKLYYYLIFGAVSSILLIQYFPTVRHTMSDQLQYVLTAAVQRGIISDTSAHSVLSLVSSLVSYVAIYDPITTIVEPGSSPDVPAVNGDGDYHVNLVPAGDAIEQVPEKITMIFAGDVMLAGNVDTVINSAGGGDYQFPWANVAGYLQQADITFINLESVISDQGRPNRHINGIKYRANPNAIAGLQYAGIDVVSLANDHVFDYGRSAMEDCINRLRSNDMKCVGAGLTYEEAYMPTYVEVKGKKIAFLAYTNIGSESCRATKTVTLPWGRLVTGASGAAWLTAKDMEQGIAKAREDMADIIVVSIHAGRPYSNKPNADQDTFAHLAIDRGADVVICSGSHVSQPTVVYDRSYNAYSLGNFIYDQSESAFENSGVTRGKIFGIVWEEGGITSVFERKVLIDETTWQPSFM